MSIKDLKEFIKLAKDEGVSSLKYESKDSKYEVSFSGGSGIVLHESYSPKQSQPATSTSNKSAKSSEKYHEIKSPFVGTFYEASSPSDPAYVKVGDKINKGTVMCILEAMKIMNEIESDVSGEIVEICVENESLVEFGQTLFKIK